MYRIFNILILISLVNTQGTFYDRYSGKKVEIAQTKELRSRNATELCSIEIKACTPHEGSRVDGTCNNYKYPSQGAARGPYLRLLKPDYGNKSEIRMSKIGESLPLARRVRTVLQSTGRVDDKKGFTTAAVNMLEFIRRDVSLLNEPRDYLRDRPHCCEDLDTSKSDKRCIPIRVPKDDPYLKVTNITCLNFSRAETFQDSSCTPKIITPEQVNFQTPLLDLSTIYGVNEDALQKIRKNERGLLILEKRNDRLVPPIIGTPKEIDAKNVTNEADNSTLDNIITNVDSQSTVTANIDYQTESAVATNNNATKIEDVCLQNKLNESICYQFGFPEAGNYNLRTTTLGIFFMREHNRLAEALHKINPCWKDDRLFKVARQINIATASNIFMYELLPALLGYRNMLNYGLISENVQHITDYMEDVPPSVYAEFEIAIRFFHTMIDGRIKKYTEKHNYIDEFSVSETLYKQFILEKEKNFEEINRGTFYQNAGKIDDILDPDVSEHYYGDLQKVHDLGAIDIQRGRDMGLRGYNDYRQLCGLKQVKKFEELVDVMEVEKMETLKRLYKDVDDIDLLAGIISENFIQGTYVGPTLFCIMSKQITIFRYSDRFWYERGDQFHSFSIAQLHEIRKTNIARLACDNAEGIKYIQPQAFYSIKPGNSLVPCTHVDGPILSKWKDSNCFKHKYSHEATHVPMSYMGQGTANHFKQDIVTNFTSFFDDLLNYKSN